MGFCQMAAAPPQLPRFQIESTRASESLEMIDDNELLSVFALVEALKLRPGPSSRKWLEDEAKAGRIPHLKIGKQYRFNLEAVVRALAGQGKTFAPRLSR